MHALAFAATLSLLAQVPVSPPVVAEPAPPPPEWVGSIGLNFIAVTGNANSVTLSTTGLAELKTEHWRWSAKLGGAYGQAEVASTTAAEPEVQIIARALSAQLRGDRKFSDLVAVFALAGLDVDHVKSLQARPLGEAGVALTWLDLKRAEQSWLSLRTDLGLRYAYDYRYQYFPEREARDIDDVALLAPRLGVAFRYAITPTITFLEDGEIMVGVLEGQRVIASSLTRLQIKVLGPLSFSAGVQVNYDSLLPDEGKLATDVIYTSGLEFAF